MVHTGVRGVRNFGFFFTDRKICDFLMRKMVRYKIFMSNNYTVVVYALIIIIIIIVTAALMTARQQIC
jgi:hypothetical protein